MFNICEVDVNGEQWFFNLIKDNISVIFDVGFRLDSLFLNFNGEVHYFDPVNEFVDVIRNKPNTNSASHYNSVGLGVATTELYYYPAHQSFHNRVNSGFPDDDSNKYLLPVKNASEYVAENNVQSIGFLKLDVEGDEFNVLQGFGDSLSNVNIIQFEYGGTYLDSNVRLIDVVNYLQEKGFTKFAYLSMNGPVLIDNYDDHYNYCNIVCVNSNSSYQPY